MNLIQLWEAKIRTRFPTAWLHLEPSAPPNGAWFLNIELNGWPVAIEWRPTEGFGITAGREPSYGDGADEFYANPSADAAMRRVIGLLLAKIQTRPAAPSTSMRATSTPFPIVAVPSTRVAQVCIGRGRRSPRRFRVVKRVGDNVFVRFHDGEQTKTAVVHRKPRAATVEG